LFPASTLDIFSTQTLDLANFGSNWVGYTISGSSGWYGVSLSASGQYQTAISYLGFFYTSSNYGSTWSQNTNVPTNVTWNSVSVSASGQYQSAVIYPSSNGAIYISSDYGSTWTKNTNAPTSGANWYSVSVSASGQYQSACIVNGSVYTSSNYGSNWSQNTSAPTTSARWFSVSVSASGQYQTAVINIGSIYTSSNYGSTWSQNTSAPTNYNWNQIAVSASGQYQIVYAAQSGTGKTYGSSDYGNTWSLKNSVNNYVVAINASGQYQITAGGSVYSYSTDYGNTWTVGTKGNSNTGVSISASGQYITLVSQSSSIIYTCQNSISSGIVNVGNYSSAPATGITGGLYYGTTSGIGITGLLVFTGATWKSVKSFVIEHLDDPSKYLVHGCLEGPESGVYYRGTSEITNNDSITIYLPDYVKNLATEFTVKITPIYDGNLEKGQYFSSRVANNKFTVYGPNGKFSWHINGKRININVEPYKNTVVTKGDGPYRWL
jgi:hypothetical protein